MELMKYVTFSTYFSKVNNTHLTENPLTCAFT